MSTQHDLIVIGAGPGGYVAAIRAAQLGLNVGCVELEPALGGTCLRVGCIPSKALLEASERFHEAQHALASFGVRASGVELDLPTMLARKDTIVEGLTSGIAGLFKKHKITRYFGHGRFTGQAGGDTQVVVRADDGAETALSAPRVIIATGSRLAPLRGVELDGDRVGGSTEALSYPEVPKHLVVIGAGVIGLELGSVWSRLGAQVTVLEYLDRILPGMDEELAREAKRVFEKQGLVFRLGSRVTGARQEGEGAVVEVDGAEPIHCDRVLLSTGRLPNTEGLALDTIGVALDERGRVPVGAHFETSAPGVYAIGDVIRGPMLAHKAEDEGVACAEYLVTGYGHVNYDAIPSVVYTHPEIACVGRTEEELKEAGVPYRKGSFPFMANGRARALGSTEGRVKMLAHAETDRVLGVHILGPRAGDLIAECAVAMEYGASSEDIARACHAHPTLAEVVKEAALAVDKRPIHI
ncbi:MAG: dihydrolipoyl dehydrogenase [Polyangiaceae bacterium]|nr:dihydrolipoyl dehydrogenase [Polyangiaceae bacterium]MCW5792687.1 dihydrolipoyl dehydrogenase [Polyangiaceae bacterium]